MKSYIDIVVELNHIADTLAEERRIKEASLLIQASDEIKSLRKQVKQLELEEQSKC